MKFRDKPALLCGDRQMTWKDLDQSTSNLAQWLLDRDLQPGDRVAVHWTNDFPAIQLMYAIFKAGLVVVTINTRLKAPEILFILNHSNSKLCFSEPALLPEVQRSGAQCSVLSTLPEFALPGESAPPLPPVDPDKPALLMYTSGTTARPKAVIHTHRSLFHTGVNAISALDLPHTEEEIGLCILPLMHMGAFSTSLASLHSGGSLVLLPRFDPAAVLQDLERFRCSVVVCMPALWHLIVNEQARNPRDVASLKRAVTAGDAAPAPLLKSFQEIFGIPLQEAYGLTESVPVTVNPREDIRPGSMGICINDIELRLVDQASQDVPTGGVGEVFIRSQANFVGYWNDPEATQAALQNGWLHTGDLGSFDADGFLWFRGRKKELIVRAGSNISPQEVEDVLLHHPAVQEAGVVGQADPVLGEIVVAFVSLRNGFTPDAAELGMFAKGQLADYKLPERYIFLPELFKGLTGKVNRRALKESLAR